jgi:hypothetical protein
MSSGSKNDRQGVGIPQVGGRNTISKTRPGWLNELGSWITKQVIQAYHQYGMDSRPAL